MASIFSKLLKPKIPKIGPQTTGIPTGSHGTTTFIPPFTIPKITTLDKPAPAPEPAPTPPPDVNTTAPWLLTEEQKNNQPPLPVVLPPSITPDLPVEQKAPPMEITLNNGTGNYTFQDYLDALGKQAWQEPTDQAWTEPVDYTNIEKQSALQRQMAKEESSDTSKDAMETLKDKYAENEPKNKALLKEIKKQFKHSVKKKKTKKKAKKKTKTKR